MILVTGAGGKTGLAAIRQLARRRTPTRALIRRGEQAAAVRKAGAHDAVVGDLRDETSLERACRGVAAIYHICPNMSPDELAIGRAIAAAARRAGVEHLVYHSVLHPETEAMPHHWRKLRVEEHLLTSGLRCTVLQPAAYMQNVRASWRRVVDEGVYAVPYAAAARVALVDLEDVARAAAIVLTEPGHEGATYPLCSGEAPDQEAIAATLARVLERPVRVEVVARRAWDRQARADGLDRAARETLLAMFRYYERHGLPGNGKVLGWLLGRPPRSLRAYLERETRAAGTAK